MNKYLNNLREKLFGRKKEPIDELKIQSLVGERLETIVANGSFDVFVTEILDPMYEESFKLFTTMDPKDFNGICQAQKAAQVVEEIKKRVERKIALGRFARERMAESIMEE